MSLLARPVILFCLTYFLTLGATFNGILMPEARLLSVVLLSVAAVIWLAHRLLSGLAFYRSPLDMAVLIWVAAFLLSWLTNTELSHRIGIGLWFMAAYIGVWYCLSDLIARRPSLRRTLADGLLLAGAIVILIGVAQIQSWLIQLPELLRTGQPLILPRPGSLIGNPNALASFLMLTLPLAGARILEPKPLVRVLSTLYVIFSLVLIVLTYSRGAWIGTVAVIGAVPLLTLYGRDLRGLWGAASATSRAIVVALGTVAAIAAGGFAWLIIQTLSVTGRSADLRTYLWDAALRMMESSPLTGQGLFTFGHEIARYSSIPPQQAQAHAHNVVFHIAAELGVIGIVALLVTGLIALRGWKQNRAVVEETGSRSDRRLLLASTAGFIGFLVHHLLDMPAMMPAVALTALIVLAIAVVPYRPIEMGRNASRLTGVLVSVTVVILIGAGLFNAVRYRAYVSILSDGVSTEAYAASAQALVDLMDASGSDPGTRVQQAMLHALAGEAEAALRRYEQVVEVEPLWAFAWANAGRLADQAGDAQTAQRYLQTAADLAPEEGWYQFWLADASERAGDVAAATAAAETALNINPSLRFLPVWHDSSLRAEVTAALPAASSEPGDRLLSVIDAIDAGRPELARELWGPDVLTNASLTAISAAVTSAERDFVAAARLLATAASQAATPSDRAWIAYSTSVFWREQGNLDEAARSLGAAQREAYPGSVVADWESGANIFYLQLYTTATPRLYVPQAEYTPVDPILVGILARSVQAGS